MARPRRTPKQCWTRSSGAGRSIVPTPSIISAWRGPIDPQYELLGGHVPTLQPPLDSLATLFRREVKAAEAASGDRLTPSKSRSVTARRARGLSGFARSARRGGLPLKIHEAGGRPMAAFLHSVRISSGLERARDVPEDAVRVVSDPHVGVREADERAVCPSGRTAWSPAGRSSGSR